MANSLQHQHQNVLYRLLLMKHCPPKTGESFPLVPSQDKDGILWLNILVCCKWSRCGFPCESCWVIQTPSCGRKWASRDSWGWKRWAASRHFPVGLWREPLSLAEKQSCFMRVVFWVLWFLATYENFYMKILLWSREGWKSRPLPCLLLV